MCLAKNKQKPCQRRRKGNNSKMKQWYLSKTIWLAVLQGVIGVVVAIGTQIPDVGWWMIAKSVLDILLRAITTDPVA